MAAPGLFHFNHDLRTEQAQLMVIIHKHVQTNLQIDIFGFRNESKWKQDEIIIPKLNQFAKISSSRKIRKVKMQ